MFLKKEFSFNYFSYRSLLSFAAECNCIDIFRFILGSKKVNPNRPDEDGNYPIHIAASKSEFIENLRCLILHPFVDPNVKNSQGNSPFMVAVENRNFKAFNLLLDSCNIDINAENELGETALFLAVKNLEPFILLNLIEIDLKPNKNQFNLLKSVLNSKSDKKPFYQIDFLHLTKKNENILHYACLYSNDDVDFVELFLNLNDLDPNLMSDIGTPLFYAFRSKNIKIVEFLLKRQPDIKVDKITVFFEFSFCFFFF